MARENYYISDMGIITDEAGNIIPTRISADGYRKFKNFHVYKIVYKHFKPESFIAGLPIHHKNANKQDDRIENLQCIERKKHHSRLFEDVPLVERTIAVKLIDFNLLEVNKKPKLKTKAPAIFDFDEQVYADFKAACKKEGRSMTWVLTEFMKNFIAAREAGK